MAKEKDKINWNELRENTCACGRNIPKRFNSTIQSKQCPKCTLLNLTSGDTQAIKKGLSKKKRQTSSKSKNSLNKRLDDAWSLLVKLRAGRKCEVCGKTKYVQSHHIFSRSNYSTRWLPENGIAACSGCHTLSSRFSFHKTPLEAYHWLVKNKGVEFIEILRIKANSIAKFHEFEKEIILKELLKEIKSYDTN